MTDLLMVVGESLAREKTRHVVSAATISAGAVVEASTSPFAPMMGVIGDLAIVMGFILTCYLLYKTSIEVKNAKLEQELRRLQLAKEGRREEDKLDEDS